MFKNLSIGKKLYVLLLVTLAGLMGMGGFNLIRMQKVYDAANYCAVNSVPSIITLDKCIAATNKLVKYTYRHILNTDAAAMTGIEQQIAAASEDYAKAMKEYEPLVSDDKDKQMLADDRAAMADWADTRNKVLTLSRENKNAEARDLLMKELAPRTTRLEQLFDAHMKYNVELSDKGTKDARETNRNSRMISLAVVLLVGVAVVLLTLAIAQAITRPIGTCVDVANSLAEGDLTVTVAVTSRDETGQLLAAMKKMVENLRKMLTQTVDISAGIASASNQLHSTSEQIATGAEEVASQCNTVATASEEMSHTSSDIAQNCLAVSDASQQASDAANSGARVVDETIKGMNVIAGNVQKSTETVEALGRRSEQIGAIVETIQDIADQTNLLALNAAIEAARAGEQGRGFAVVADEVRALAERTTKATHEISGMIGAIQKETKEAVATMEEGVREVEKGVATSMESGKALEEILVRANEVSMQVSQIATAAEEQTATTGEVSMNIQQITEVVQQTARGAEETAGAAAQLAEQAQQLQTLVGQFRLT